MKIVIVGPGAMGCLFAGLLSKSNEVWLLDRNPARVKHIRKYGLKISGLSNIKIPPQDIGITTNTHDIGPAELIIILVKSYDTESAIKKVLPCIDKKTLILSLQNGINNPETIKKSVHKKFSLNIFAGITSQGATSLGFGEVRRAGMGETLLGTGCKKIYEVFNNSGIKTRIIKNIESALWSKLIINSAINPLGAVTKRENGELVKDRYLKRILIELADESTRVAVAKGIKLLYKDFKHRVIKTCLLTGSNINSMLQDVLNGKKTEIDNINGVIIAEAKKLNISVPFNELLYNLINLYD